VFDDETVATAVETLGSVNVDVTDEATFDCAAVAETTMLEVLVTGVPFAPFEEGVTIEVIVYVPATRPVAVLKNRPNVAPVVVALLAETTAVTESPVTSVVAPTESVPAPVPRVFTAGSAVEVAVSRNNTEITGAAARAAAVGAADTNEVIVAESVFACAVNETATVAAVVESDTAVVAVPAVDVTVRPITAAFDGATEMTPRPNAATATSAMRLNVVFVDICFLSIVELRTIRISAWIKSALS